MIGIGFPWSSKITISTKSRHRLLWIGGSFGLSLPNMRSLLILFLFLPVRSSCLLCQQCGGQLHNGKLRLMRGLCCTATTIECPVGLACLRALVVSSRKNFILSGCYFPEDGLIGCDSHTLPHNGTIQRCVCMDQSCQLYFPNGTCPKGLAALVRSNSGVHPLNLTVHPTTQITETLISSPTAVRIEKFADGEPPTRLLFRQF
ncbi:hypothetical protein KIN20_000672 [Parelaphostrongylus tenuis]|uniref:Uncharacterized protein n=1 Tax=Parelaphostrongylus tenuis TaxID=148309 RepID=A0AAD5LWG4_PARTN|nr:hypothetical protein KIN20_000672 [Parelaphostrongylus tenuis]